MSNDKQTANPYLNAKRAWDERYGDLIARAHSARIMAAACCAVSAIAVIGIAYIGSQSKIEPMVVVLDTLGTPLALAQPSKDKPDKRIIEAQIANWVWESRIVMADGSAQEELLKRVYAMAGSEAAKFLNAEYALRPPFGGHTVSASITSVLPISQDTLQITWNETTTKDGQAQPAQQWKANIVTGFDPKLSAVGQVNLRNPLGIFVRSVTWTQLINSK